jgi:hypothetical protein
MSTLGWGLGIGAGVLLIGGTAYAVVESRKTSSTSTKALKEEPKNNPNQTPLAPQGYAWKKVADGSHASVFPGGAYLLMEWYDHSSRTAAEFAQAMQQITDKNGKKVWTVFSTWEPGMMPDNWPGSKDTAFMRFYARTEMPVTWPEDNPFSTQFAAYGVLKA